MKVKSKTVNYGKITWEIKACLRCFGNLWNEKKQKVYEGKQCHRCFIIYKSESGKSKCFPISKNSVQCQVSYILLWCYCISSVSGRRLVSFPEQNFSYKNAYTIEKSRNIFITKRVNSYTKYFVSKTLLKTVNCVLRIIS